jgi:DNA-binding MarR family transcriptional regulator
VSPRTAAPLPTPASTDGTVAGSAAGDEDLAAVRLGITRLQRLLSSRRVHGGMAAAAGVSLPQQALQVLRALGDQPPQAVSDVARAARMDNGAVSRQLKVLEDEGLVRRRTSPAHGSIVLVEATAEGRRVNRRYELVRGGHLGRALADWTPEERHELGRLLVRLVDDLQATPYLDPEAP